MIKTPIYLARGSVKNLALEMIDIQDSDFGNRLTAIHTTLKMRVLAGDYEHSRAIKDSDEVKAITKLIKARLNAKVGIIVNSNVAAVMPLFSNKNHIFVADAWKGNFKIKDQELFMATLKSQRGTVDLANAKLGGLFSEYEHKFFMNYKVLFKELEMSPSEVTAVTLHELGHLFTTCLYTDRMDSNNQVMMGVADYIATKKRDVDLTYVYTELKKIDPNVSEEEVDKICGGERIIAGYNWYKFVAKAVLADFDSQNGKQPGERVYDQTSSEAMADNFCTRFGYGKELISGLDKMSRAYGALETSGGWLIAHQLLSAALYGAIFFYTVMIIWALPFALVSFFMGLVMYTIALSSAEHNRDFTYDELKVRYLRIRQQLVGYLKDIALPADETKIMLENIAYADDVMKNTHQFRTLIQHVSSFLFSDARAAKGSIAEQHLMEEFASNDFFIKSAELRTL
jgi:hypothetical protein